VGAGVKSVVRLTETRHVEELGSTTARPVPHLCRVTSESGRVDARRREKQIDGRKGQRPITYQGV
jgi:hypothetical protein